jgi:hypothetical protein
MPDQIISLLHEVRDLSNRFIADELLESRTFA